MFYTDHADTIGSLSLTFKAESFTLALFGQVLTLQGTMKALQKQRNASIILVLCLYIVSLPMAYWFAFGLNKGVQGLWWGFSIGYIPSLILYLIEISRIDWLAHI